MLLQALHEYALNQQLVDSVELTRRTIHLALNLNRDGTVPLDNAWVALDLLDPKDKKNQKRILGRSYLMPRFPGENNGGKAHFLADVCGTVFGVDPKSGFAWPDDPKVGKNPTKAFLHFWKRIEEAHEALPASEDLQALLKFRARYLNSATDRDHLPFASLRPFGKEGKATFCALTNDDPTPLESRTICFRVEGLPVFEPKSDLHAYWTVAYRRQTSSEAGEANQGLCLVTVRHDQPIAGSHKPEIKGVPNLPPKGGYLVSFAREAPAFASYGFEGSSNAPVSESAVTAYTLALNALLANPATSRRLGGDLVLCSWLRDHPDDSGAMLNLLEDPHPDEVDRFFKSFEAGQPRADFRVDRYYSISLAANGGRVAVRRWLDRALSEVNDSIISWFDDLDIAEILRSEAYAKKKTELSPDRKTYPYRSILSLAWATARTPSNVQSAVYDILYRAALERTNPESLLAPTLARVRVAAIQSGANVVYQTPKFALIKLILNRLKDRPMTIEPQLCETYDPAYNCGRLLAVLDAIQRRALGNEIGADIVARYYGNASSFPSNSFARLTKLARTHLNKLRKGDDKSKRAGQGLENRLNEIMALFQGEKGQAPEFPGQLTLREQGRFALGFHQQKASDYRIVEAYRAAKRAGQTVTETAEALAGFDEQD